MTRASNCRFAVRELLFAFAARTAKDKGVSSEDARRQLRLINAAARRALARQGR